MESVFSFQQFDVIQLPTVHKVGTDSMVLGALIAANQPKRILDIGTGTGVLALMLAQRFDCAEITAIEIADEAAELALKNVTNSPFSERITVVNQDLLQFSPSEKFDLIVSNPPYYATNMFSPDSSRTLARHEINLPLDNLLSWSMNYLNTDGKVVLILPYDRTETIEKVATRLGFYISEKIIIFGKPNHPSKVILSFTTNSTDVVLSSLTIRDEVGKYTEAYKKATKDFHLKEVL